MFSGDAAEQKALRERLLGLLKSGNSDMSALIEEFGGDPDDYSLGGEWAIWFEKDKGGDTPVMMWAQMPWGEDDGLGDLIASAYPSLEVESDISSDDDDEDDEEYEDDDEDEENDEDGDEDCNINIVIESDEDNDDNDDDGEDFLTQVNRLFEDDDEKEEGDDANS